jgi:hypothetical protein
MSKGAQAVSSSKQIGVVVVVMVSVHVDVVVVKEVTVVVLVNVVDIKVCVVFPSSQTGCCNGSEISPLLLAATMEATPVVDPVVETDTACCRVAARRTGSRE